MRTSVSDNHPGVMVKIKITARTLRALLVHHPPSAPQTGALCSPHSQAQVWGMEMGTHSLSTGPRPLPWEPQGTCRTTGLVERMEMTCNPL